MVLSLHANLGPLTLLLAAFGVVRAWRLPVGPAATGAFAATVIGIVANPLGFAVDRTVTLPAVPIAIILAVFAISSWAFRAHAQGGERRYGAYAWIVPP
jgi:CHASE2 domain-containing sensor protein